MRREMSQKDFAEVLGVKTSTVNAMEINGLSHKIKIYFYLEKLGYEPVSKLKEILNKKF